MPHFSTVTVVSLHEAEIIPTLGSSTRVENKYIFPITGNVQLTDIVPGAPVYIPHLHLVLGDGRASVVRGSLHQEYNVVQNIHMYDSMSDLGEIRVYQRADFQSGSRVLKKVF